MRVAEIAAFAAMSDNAAMSHSDLTNQLLIAMPAMDDPNFARTVTLICEHNDDGALGLIINRRGAMHLTDVFDQLSLDHDPFEGGSQLVLSGGPVQKERGFVVHDDIREWDSTLQVAEHISVTMSRDILAAMARGDGPENAFVALGYAGWSPGQLEQEIGDNAWLSVPADEQILFSTPLDERWQAAAGLLGVDLSLLSPDVGHA